MLATVGEPQGGGCLWHGGEEGLVRGICVILGAADSVQLTLGCPPQPATRQARTESLVPSHRSLGQLSVVRSHELRASDGILWSLPGEPQVVNPAWKHVLGVVKSPLQDAATTLAGGCLTSVLLDVRSQLTLRRNEAFSPLAHLRFHPRPCGIGHC